MRKSHGSMFVLCIGILCIGLGMIGGCSDPISSDATMIGVAFQAGPYGGNGIVRGDSTDQITQINVTRARVVLGRIEVRGENDTTVFRSEEHTSIILDLDLTGRPRTLLLAPSEPGAYSSAMLRIAKLEPTDPAWEGNPDMQDHSLMVEGYLNGDPAQTFVFSTGLDEEQGHEFEPVLVEEKGSTVIVFQFDYTRWFKDDLGNLVNPDNGQLAAWRSVVEENIVNSLSVQ